MRPLWAQALKYQGSKEFFEMKPMISRLFLIFLGLLAGALPAQAELRSEMKLFSDSFISSAFESNQKTNYQFFGARLKTEETAAERNGGNPDVLRMDLSGGVAFGAPLLNYLNFSELYVQLPVAEEQSFTMGRKKLNWNDLDARWDLGVWEPVFKWNPLSPQRQGLVGLFWELERKNYGLTLFASPLYLPDEGPSFEIDNGEFVSGNPWFHRPPDSIHIFNETTKIEYNLQKPKESEVILQRSYGGKIRLGSADSLMFQVSQIYKPSNQLALGYDGVLDIPRDRGVVDLQPQVFYHSLTGADLTYRFMNWKYGVSGLYDRPDQKDVFDSKWTQPVFQNAVLVSAFVEAYFHSFKLYAQRLDISGGEVTEKGDLANPGRRPLMTRYPYRQANEVGVAGQYLFSRSRRLIAGVSYIRSDKNDFSLVKFNGRFRLSSMWSLYSEMQLIEAGPLTVSNQNDIAQFANNDRFLIGVAYVF